MQTERKESIRRERTALVFAFVAAIGSQTCASLAFAEFPEPVRDCREAVAKASTKLTKALLKTVTACHKSRARDAGLAGADCNDLVTTDLKQTAAKAVTRFTNTLGSTSRCTGVTTADALFDDCPAPCDAAVATIDDFGDVAACVVCLARTAVRSYSTDVNGTPASPLPTSEESRCARAISGASSKLFALAMRNVARCQAREEDAGAMSTGYCSGTAFPSPDTDDDRYDAADSIFGACDEATFTGLDTCATTALAASDCVPEQTLGHAQALLTQVLGFTEFAMTTTTVTTLSTTTTTLLPADPLCPNLGELVLYSHDSNIPCTTNGDCAPPRSCDSNAGICVTLSDLDSGWTGHAHDSDLNDEVLTQARLHCPGPGPVCGQCQILGIDPSTGSCRCANNVRNHCDQPFVADADDCGGAVCDCYFGVPIPLSSAGTPACIVNRYIQNIRGTANLDTGEQLIDAKLRTRVYLGATTIEPCPMCEGKCSNDATESCQRDIDCPGGTCIQDTPNDGVRDGLCERGQSDDLPCDVGGINATFPAHSNQDQGGGGFSLDCLPTSGLNISGQGLALNIAQTTGTSTLSAGLPCNGQQCFCKTCSTAPTFPCSDDSDCSGAGCTLSPNTLPCGSNADCTNRNLGTCLGAGRCQNATEIECANNADCQNYAAGTCDPATCSVIGSAGAAPKPNACAGFLCNDAGDGEGQCATGPDDELCDGVLRANGKGILSCNTNADCTANDPFNGTCSLVQRRECFLDPIVATGSASTQFPLGAATFCVPPTANSSINSVAGLPGPARVLNQGRSRALCASNPAVEYQPGVGGCP